MLEHLSDLDRMQLRWLAQQTGPVWGGHLNRGEPISDPDLARWIRLGLVEEWSGHRERGYRATDLWKGVAAALSQAKAEPERSPS